MEEIPNLDKCDILVVGGGPAGSAAATIAGRHGAKTILVEKNGFLGGNLTSAGIDTMYGLYTVGNDPHPVVGGITDEIIDQLRKQNACYERRNTYGAGIGVTFSTENMKLILEDLALKEKVKIFYHTFGTKPLIINGRFAGCMVASKSGLHAIEAKVIIDTTGDADLITRAGGETEKAFDSGNVQSCTTVFFMANVDIEKAKGFGKKAIWDEMRKVNEAGEFNLPRIEGSFHATPNPSMIELNMTRINNVDITDVQSISLAETIGRHQVQQYVKFLNKYVPGFEHAYLTHTGSQLGMREGRRIIGDYVLSKDDVIQGAKFEDCITRCGQPIEDHHAGNDTKWIYIENDGFFEIPYRCLVPKNLNNFLTAGRSLSATHDAHASARSSGTAFSMGQAAAIAAVLALDSDVNVRKIEISTLQNNLRRIGAII